MPNPSVGTQIHQSLYIHCCLSAQITFDSEFRNHVPELRDLWLSEVFYSRSGINLSHATCHKGTAATNAVDLRQRDTNVLVDRNVDASNTSHSYFLNPAAACVWDRSRSL